MLKVLTLMELLLTLLSLLPTTDHSLSHKTYGLNSKPLNTPKLMTPALDVVSLAALPLLELMFKMTHQFVSTVTPMQASSTILTTELVLATADST